MFARVRGSGMVARLSRHHSVVTPAIEAAAKHRTTSVTLYDLFKFGENQTSEQRLRNAQFLHRELPIRIAQRVVELSNLPYGLSEKQDIMNVREWFAEYFELLSSAHRPTNDDQEKEYTTLLDDKVLQDHNAVIQTMALGVLTLRQELGKNYTRSMAKNIDVILNRFFMARIGLRFLIEHHITTAMKREGYSGIIMPECSPVEIAEMAAEDAVYLAEHHLGQAPEIKIIGDRDDTFTYVPMHLHYILTELLKNSVRATVETHGEQCDETGTDLPDVHVVVASGNSDVTIKVSDEGGGIPYDSMDKCWSYVHSSVRWESAPSSNSNSNKPQSSIWSPTSQQRHSSIWSPQARGTGLSFDPILSVDAGVHTTQVSAQAQAQAQAAVGGEAEAGADMHASMQHISTGVSALAGYGCGLPLSRLYAGYFGGGLNIMSMEGHGTDAYCHLNRLGTHCENLPQGVVHSPAERDSSFSTFINVGGKWVNKDPFSTD